ncbi:uncharacterized protein AKAME5_001626400 [Lates japonicus]|uniref:Ig-like domain-containing protein n=1 Tax=Lates japonicus TaxID=270547 RepID=A0AAD3N0W0_LATJO|nr:uncharacterized protein AKAME5_001626400 [Lates japonicus]
MTAGRHQRLSCILTYGALLLLVVSHHERLSDPVLTISSTWHASDESCTVLLECTVTSDSSVTYKWAVRNQSLSGSRLQYILRPQDGETTFTCTVSNSVGVKSVFKNEKCSNETYEKTDPLKQATRMKLHSMCTPLFYAVMALSMKQRKPLKILESVHLNDPG